MRGVVWCGVVKLLVLLDVKSGHCRVTAGRAMPRPHTCIERREHALGAARACRLPHLWADLTGSWAMLEQAAGLCHAGHEPGREGHYWHRPGMPLGTVQPGQLRLCSSITCPLGPMAKIQIESFFFSISISIQV
jgi:hypothetical protein